ncbi:MAG TPA: ECF-type sigma factor, partial [Bryobacteraceae bacterium]|nr:ECF-type sigma factor [Bryobacteraceae bacterium]
MSTRPPKLFEKLNMGEDSGLSELTPALYSELRRIASRHLRGERFNHTLQATALVHEAYLKLFEGAERRFAGEVHFLAVASRVMRQVLVDHARARAAQKRSAGAGTNAVSITNLEVSGEKGVELLDLIRLDGAIDALAAEDEPLAR